MKHVTSKTAKEKLTRRLKRQRAADFRTGLPPLTGRPSFKRSTVAGSPTQMVAASTPAGKGFSTVPGVKSFTEASGVLEATGRAAKNKCTLQGPRTFAEVTSGSARYQKVSTLRAKHSVLVLKKPSTSSGTQNRDTGEIKKMDKPYPEPNMRGVDSHFHLVRLASLVRKHKPLGKCIAFSSVLRDAFVPAKVPDQTVLDFAISSFCDDWFHKQLLGGARRKVRGVTTGPPAQTSIWPSPEKNPPELLVM